jgi:drug/metabolite transporter (DMT)-like permease
LIAAVVTIAVVISIVFSGTDSPLNTGRGMRQSLTALSLHQKGILMTSFGGILFTLDIPLLRLAGEDAWTLIFGRGVFLCLAITAWWFFWYRMRGHKVPFINGRPGLVVAVTNTLANLMFIAAVTMTTAANLVFILALNPILCALIARVFLGEKLHPWTATAVLMSFVGVLIIGADGLTTGPLPGDLMALGVALMTAIALTVIRKSGKNVVSSLAVGSLASALIASVWAAPLALSFAGWGWLGLNGLLVIPLASALIALGPRYLPAPEVAMFFLLDTMLTPIWIWVIFAEVPTPVSMIGGSIVIVTLMAHSLWRFRTSSLQTAIELSPH